MIREVDRDDDPQRWRAFLTAQGFGHFAASGRDRDVPVVVPTQYVLLDHEIVLHLIANNPVFAALDENPRAVLSVAGDWAFIPGAWKAIGDEDRFASGLPAAPLPLVNGRDRRRGTGRAAFLAESPGQGV